VEVRNKNADPDAKKNLPAVVHPNVVVSPHPLSASAGRKLFYTEFVPGESLDEYLTRNHLMPPVTNNFVISVNGKVVAFDKLDTVFPRKGDMIIIRARVHGGDDGGSNPLVVVLMIAVLIASQGSAAGWISIMSSGTIPLAVSSAIIVVGGMLLISALVPANVPSIDDSQPDPTYSLSGSANRTRAYEPLPVVFGVVRMYPDHAARPFTAYELNDQKLLQIFNFGLTNPALTELKIGDAPLEDFIGIETEPSPGTTGNITLFPSNVDSLAGADLIANAGVFIERTSSADTTRLVVDISGLSFFIGREEGLTNARITVTIEYRVADSSGAWLPFSTAATFDIVNGDKEVMRLPYHRFVALGQYEVRVKLHDLADVVSSRVVCDYDADNEPINCETVVSYSGRGLNEGGMTQVLSWDQLKSYQPDLGDYTNQKRFALEIRANSQLQGRVDAFNAIASVTIPSWNGSAWVNAVSSNPADQFLALARGLFDSTGRRLYGAGLPDSRIDILAIQDWADWCSSKSLNCNIVMTGKMTVIDMMNTVARVGRGTATWANGLLGVVYDEGNKSPVAMFGMANMIRNSFKVNYVSENQVDEVVVAFNNPDIGWKRDTVRVLVPGVISPVNTVTIDIPGITDEVQAAKEANMIAAEQFYRRRMMTWETDIEGLTVQRGDVAVMSHDVTQWDYSGRLAGGPTTTQLKLDREVEYGTAGYVGIRFPDGTYEIKEVTSFVGPSDTLLLLTPLSTAPDADLNNDVGDYLWFYGPTATPGKLVKITDVTPLSEDRVRIVATDEDDDYYLSESNTYTYVTPTIYTTNIPIINDLQLGETLTIVGSGFASKVNVSWNVTGEYGGAFIRAGDEDTPLRDIGRTLDQRFSFEWPTDKTVTVEVTLHNQNYEMSDASRATASLLLVGKMRLPADVTNFTVLQNGEVIVMKWTQVPDVDLAGYDIRFGKRGASTYAGATPLTSVTRGTNVTSADIPPGDWTVYIKAVDTSGNYSANATSRDIVAVTNRDVIVQIEQAPAWSGTLTNFVLHHTGKMVPQSQNSADDGAVLWADDTVFEEFVINPYQICIYEAPEIDIDFDDEVRVWGSIESELGLGITTGIADPHLSIDHKLSAGAYDGFEAWSIGNVTGRYFKHKLTMDTGIGLAVVTGFTPTVDQLEHELSGTETLSAAWTTIAFTQPFHATPFVTATAVTDGTSAKYAAVDNITSTSFDVALFNSSGTLTTGTVNWLARGI